jgi:hypothetical protein
MTTIIAEVYDALCEAGTSEAKARAAAQAFAEYSRDIGEIKATMTLLKWILVTNLAFTLAIVWRIFS